MLEQKKKLDEDIDELSKEGDKLQDMVVKQDTLLRKYFVWCFLATSLLVIDYGLLGISRIK